MTILAGGALIAAMVWAVGDWVAVARRLKRLEYVAKPAVIVKLLLAAAVLDPAVGGGRREWVLVALVFCLAGDVFLMLPSDRFVEGLGSFLLGHVAYVVAFTRGGDGVSPAVVGMAVALAGVAWVLWRVARAAAGVERALGVAVAVYGIAIMAMALAAASSGSAVAIVGAVLFMTSDALIGWNRFVQPLSWAPLTIIVTYHVAQLALVLSLV